MKVLFVEEIEPHRAWTDWMGCMHCGELKYNVHRQIRPEVEDNWWVECPICEHQGPHAPTRKLAILGWKKDDEL